MSQIIGLQQLNDWVEHNGLPYYAVYDSDRTTDNRKKYGDNFDVDNATVSDCIKSLNHLLSLYAQNGIRCYIWLRPNQKETKGGYYSWFSLPATNVAATVGTPQVSVDSINAQVANAVAEALAKFKAEQELTKLKEELAELKKENKELAHGPIERVVKRLDDQGYIGVMVDHFFPMKTQQAAAVVSGTDEEKQTIAENALAVLAEGEDDLHLTLQKLAEMKKSNPAKYNMAKSML